MDLTLASMEIPNPSQSQTKWPGNDAMVRAGIEPVGRQAQCLADEEMKHNTGIIVTYLLDRVPEFRRLADLRQKVNLTVLGVILLMLNLDRDGKTKLVTSTFKSNVVMSIKRAKRHLNLTSA